MIPSRYFVQFVCTTCSSCILCHSWCSPPLNTLKHLHRSSCPKHGSPHPYNSWKHQSSIRSKSSFVMPLCVTIDKVLHTISAFSSSVFFAHAILLIIMVFTCLPVNLRFWQTAFCNRHNMRISQRSYTLSRHVGSNYPIPRLRYRYGNFHSRKCIVL